MRMKVKVLAGGRGSRVTVVVTVVEADVVAEVVCVVVGVDDAVDVGDVVGISPQ